MKAKWRRAGLAVVVVTFIAGAASTRAATVPVSGWVVHNGTSTVGGTASNPIFTPGDNITVMAPFADVVLANNGDFVQGTTTLTMNTRTGTGINTLNTQLRVGLFHNNASSVVTANDVPNVGFIIEYTNLVAGGLIREQTNTAQTSPFTSPTNIGNGTQDSGADSIQGVNPGPVTFDLKLTRNAGKIDLVGTISGNDPVSGNPYFANYTVTGYSSTTFPADGTFTFNRIALFLGDGVNAASASLSDSSITTVPEPGSIALAGIAIGSIMLNRRARGGAPPRQ
jgi:hypothetical protein